MLAEFGAQFANMFAVVLMVAAGITFVAYALTTPRSSANLVLAIGILGVVLLNAVIGFAQEHAAERTAEALQALVGRRALTTLGVDALLPRLTRSMIRHEPDTPAAARSRPGTPSQPEPQLALSRSPGGRHPCRGLRARPSACRSRTNGPALAPGHGRCSEQSELTAG